MNSSQHLTPELLFGYEHQLLSPQEAQSVHEHIAACEKCRQELAQRMDVGAMASDIESALTAVQQNAPRRSLWPYAAAAAVLLVAGASLWFARRTAQPETVQEALRAERIPVPAFVTDLNPGREVLMGNTDGPKAVLLSPRGTAVTSRRPEFQWQPLAGMWTYRVRVFTPSMELAGESPELSGAAWTLDRDLAGGVTYEWQVVAMRAGERVTLPQPPDTPPRFRVVEPATADRLRQLALDPHSSHLLLAVEYGQAGLLEDARREMAQAIAEHPDDRVLRKLLDSLSVRDR